MLDRVDNMLDRVDNTLDRVDNMLDRVDNTLDRVDNMLDRVENMLDRVDNMLDRGRVVVYRKVLAQLLYRPDAGAQYSWLTWELGRGIGEYLLQQASWMLQDVETLTGNTPLSRVIQRRCGVGVGAAGRGGSGPQTYSVPPFGMERGVADLVLASLAVSPGARQRDFAEQLQRLADLVGKAGARGPMEAGAGALPEEDFAVGGLGNVGSPPAGPSSGSLGEEAGSPALQGEGTPLRRKVALGTARLRRAMSRDANTPLGVQVVVWMRLLMLMPLLPVIYPHREQDPAKNLRQGLATSLTKLAAHPLLNAVPAAQGAGAGAAEAAAAAAAEEAGEPLFGRLLSILFAVLGVSWAPWLRGEKTNLRDVPPFEGSRQLHAHLLGSTVSPGTRLRIGGALPVLVQDTPAVPPAGPGQELADPQLQSPPGNRSPVPAAPKTDVWLLLGDGRADGEVTGVDGVLRPCLNRPEPCLAGALPVKRPRLSYCGEDSPRHML
eukprot:jgi/Botrbrau1/643/Bobra.0161s0032.1